MIGRDLRPQSAIARLRSLDIGAIISDSRLVDHQTYHRWADAALAVLGWVGLLTLGLPVWMVGTQIYTWLRYGYWPRNPISDWLAANEAYPWTDWAGVQSIIDWFASWPASMVVFLLGLAVCALVGWVSESMRQHGDRLYRKQKATKGPIT